MAVNITNEQLLDYYEKYGSLRKVADLLKDSGVDINYSTICRRLKQAYPDYTTKNIKIDDRPIAGGTVKSPDKKRTKLEGTRFVFTTAQNNTYVHKGFFEALKNYCDIHDAQLIVSAVTYNKSGFQNSTKEDDGLWYDPLIKDFLVNESCEITDDLVFCGELDILPTAVTPLSGFENYTQEASAIIPHTKVQMQSLPRMKECNPRFLYTTGSITLRNYIQRKAGQKAEFHHVFGALLVEIDKDGDWFARQLVANEDGVFHDLDWQYDKDGVETFRVAAITWGDIHIEKIDPTVFKAAWGDENSMLTELNPQYQFIHDLTDFTARNHHNINDPYHLAKMHHRGTGNVEKDLQRSGAFLQYITRKGNTAVVVDSNHDQALQKWLQTVDIRKDPENAEFFHRASMLIHSSIRKKEDFNVYQWAVTADNQIKSDTIFLEEDDSFIVHGIEQGLHGHRGPNGARGNAKGFRSIGRKVNIGHSHSAGIIDGVYVAGVSGLLDMDYNKGPSSWSHSHILTYTNGKRTIITMKNGKWRA